MRNTSHARWPMAWITISQRVVDMLDVEAICQAVCDGCVNDLGYGMAWVGVMDCQQPDVLRPIAQSGFDEVPDVDEEGYRDLMGRSYCSSVAFPLKGYSGLIGALNVYAAEPDAFGEEDVLLLSMLTAHTGMALENARRYQAEQRQWHMAESLRQVAAILNTTLDLDVVLTRIMEQLKRVIRYDSAGVLLQDGDDLVVSEGVGFPDPDLIIGQRIPLSSDDPAARVFNNRHTLIIANVQADPNWIQTSGVEHIRGWMGVPLLANEKSIGALIVGSTEMGTYGQEEAQVALAFANQAAIAIENARLHAETERRTRQLTVLHELDRAITASLRISDVYYAVAHHTARLLPYDRTSITLLEGDKVRVTYVAGAEEAAPLVGDALPLKTSDVGRVAAQGQPILRHNIAADARCAEGGQLVARGIRSIMVIPLRVKGQAIGSWNIGSRQAGAYSPDDLVIAQSMADQLAIAIENARLYEEIHQRADELATLNRISQAITSTLDLQETLTIITKRAIHLLGVAAVSVALRDEANGDLWFAAASGEGSDFVRGKRLAIGEGIVGWCVQHGEPVLVPDVSEDSRFFGDFDRESGFTTRSILCVPLQAKGQTIGAIEVMNKESGPFDQEDLRLLASLSAPAATAIENARLYKDLRDQMQAREEAQAQLMQSEKLAAIGRLVAGVAHELNNPLTSVLGFAQLLQHSDIGEEARSDLDKIVAEARRAAHIVQGLLDFARQRAPERKPAQINDLVAGTLSLLAYELRAHHIECTTHFSSDLPLTMVDPYQLQQVWVNLVHNARQAMSAAHGGGHLSISTELGPSISSGSPEGKHPDTSGDEPVIRIIVKDDGPGIASHWLPQIFDPFFTTKPAGEGTGLGLSVCHGIVSEHGGHIWAESEPGRGTAFFVELPVVVPEALHQDSAPARTETSAPAQSMLADTARILIIDDRANVLELVVRALQRAGYQVDAVSDGDTALSRLAETSYDLILCDVRMPGLNGLEIYRQVQGQDPDLAQRIIFTTGDTISPDTLRFLDETGVSYLSKPFELADLIKIVREAISRR